MSTPILEVRNVSKVYDTGKTSVQALREVSLSIEESEFITITGPSGSGKSTLLNIMGLLDEPTEGDVMVEGKSVLNLRPNALADLRSKTFSFIFQTFNLNPVLSVEENVMIPLFIRRDVDQAEKKRRVHEWIDHVGLTQHLSHRPDELSGGQRQRVAIARAMVGYPKLVFADEPTANLDSKTSKTILELMRDLNSERGTAFVFSTHDSMIRSYARRQVNIIDGVLTEGGFGEPVTSVHETVGAGA